jgi:3-keto-5-aminohexanoate cleavage enzyme
MDRTQARTTPLVITAAICGAEVTRDQNPAVPYTAEELAAESERCFAEGARVIHLHVRRPDGSPTQDRETFRAAIQAIKARVPDAIVQVSTGGAVGMSVEERTQPLDLRPEFCSLTTGTCNFGDEVFSNPFPLITAIAEKAKTMGTRMEIEVFDAGFVDNALLLARRGILPEPLHFDFVLGVPGAMTGTEDRLDFLLGTIPVGSTWMVAGVGRFELPLATAAIARGGHVRVGLEDNLFVSRGVLAKGSWELVRAAAAIARDAGRPLATPDQTREILRLDKR